MPPSSPKRRPQVRVALLVQQLLGGLVSVVLRHVDAECRPVASQSEVRQLLSTWSPDILIADLDTFEKAPEWARTDGTSIPCLGLTRRRETMTKLQAFERGATDVIEIPFTPDEIVVRTVAALMRSTGRRVEIQSRLRIGRFEMELEEPRIRLNDGIVKLTLLEQTLLYVFLAHPGQTLTREDILTNIWGSQSAVTSNVIDRHIRDLRVKLQEKWREPRSIATDPGKGYRFVGDGAP
ncbi:MAG: response regulator transcription factor [Chloroflexota bacterium]|nr:response regulator transcription factor [Chloroflexota bacterium]